VVSRATSTWDTIPTRRSRFDHRKPAYAVLDHRPEGLVDRVVGPDSFGLYVSELGYGRRCRTQAFDHAAHRDVAVGDHALQLVVLAADRQNRLQVAHLSRSVGQNLLRSSEKTMVSDSVRLDARDLDHDLSAAQQGRAGLVPKCVPVTHLAPLTRGLGSAVAGYLVTSDNSLPLGAPAVRESTFNPCWSESGANTGDS
jgi:hypothetical protein